MSKKLSFSTRVLFEGIASDLGYAQTMERNPSQVSDTVTQAA
jgi:hypothetical protein